jgi:hypothetical protein
MGRPNACGGARCERPVPQQAAYRISGLKLIDMHLEILSFGRASEKAQGEINQAKPIVHE